MWVAFWLALALFASGATYSYAIGAPKRRVYLTTASASAAWGILAITAPAVFTLTETGETVPVGAPLELQLFVTGMAVFSLLVLVLYYLGLYPPESNANDPTEPDRS
ncbi:hypothetical protein HPS36_02065 [Halorubrum salinarum]|uniref:Uncharacterized protein n=1 Tax=Halorubrum salinarum TaxID=2739057 RepID=A0A7D3YC77_9EURY|nr:hypothetical protein [Halorubrum salinarum]QKG91688.1 hypothetical protein HPS36_02065 [Halorubrum salinarum]